MALKKKKYPHEFLGRCATCLDNAYLSSEPCPTGSGNGMPLKERDCLVKINQEVFDKRQEAFK